MLGVLEGFSPIVWGIATYMVATSHPFAIFIVGAALLVPLVCYFRARAKGFDFRGVAGTSA